MGNMGMSPRRGAAGAAKYLNLYTESLIPNAWLTVVRGKQGGVRDMISARRVVAGTGR